jgi:hypothetical protein
MILVTGMVTVQDVNSDAMDHGQSPHMAAFVKVMMPSLAGALAAEMWAAEPTSMG